MPRLRQLFAVGAIVGLLIAGGTPRACPSARVDGAQLTIPFRLTASNTIVVRAVLNGSDELDLMLHTAARNVTLTEDAVRKTTSLTFTGARKVEAWGGEAESRYSEGNQVQIGPLRRTDIDVWENRQSGEDTDGKFGLDFFQSPVVEIDFDEGRIALHDELPDKAGAFDRLEMENHEGLLRVEGDCQIGGESHPHTFLIHSGYSGGILLDDAFVAASGLGEKMEIIDETRLTDSFGNPVIVKKGVVPVFVLGESRLSNVPAGFFAGALGAQSRSVIGGGVLGRFNLIFDLANDDLYIAPRRGQEEPH